MASAWRTTPISLLLISQTLLGCTTELWEAARGKEETIGIKVSKVVSASKSDQADHVSVCMVLFDPDKQTEKEVTLRIPLADMSLWNVRDIRTFDNVQRTIIEYLPALSDLIPGCTVEKTQITLLQFEENEFRKQARESKESQNIKLDKAVTEAVYIVNRYDSPEHVGYVSAKPITENGYAISVPVYKQFKYPVKRDSKPLLYLFTPFTVAFDAVLVGAALIVAAPMCGDANRGCFGKDSF